MYSPVRVASPCHHSRSLRIVNRHSGGPRLDLNARFWTETLCPDCSAAQPDVKHDLCRFCKATLLATQLGGKS
eukprot:6332214-Amphidinium_carterae.1